jgi:hypothetical protein
MSLVLRVCRRCMLWGSSTICKVPVALPRPSLVDDEGSGTSCRASDGIGQYNTFYRTIGCLLIYAIPQALKCAILCLEDEVNLMVSSARISTELNP